MFREKFFDELLSLDKENETLKFFYKIAYDLFNEYILISRNSYKYRLREIEFYLHTARHPDRTSHLNERAKLFGEWYVHRFGKKASNGYSTFSPRVGLDIALGTKDIFFGILIRGIYDIQNNLLISGPIKVVNELYGNGNEFIQASRNYSNYLNYSKKVEENKVFEKNDILYLSKTSGLEIVDPIFEKRTGLNNGLHSDFANRLYKARI